MLSPGLIGQRYRSKPLRLALCLAIEESHKLVHYRGPVGLRGDIGGEKPLGLNAEPNIGAKGGFE